MVPVFLVGFMATGKSTVGRQVAADLGRRFVDLDELIAERAGASAATMVARDEPAFRAAEARAIEELCGAPDAPIVATGGGAAVHSIERMRAAGLVIALTATLDTTRARAASGGGARPLLDDRADARLAARMPFYRRAHAAIATDRDDAHAVAAKVRHAIACGERLGAHLADSTILALGDRSYPVLTLEGELDADLVRAHLPGVNRIALVTDDNVRPLHADRVARALDAQVFSFPAGEASKTLATFDRLCGELAPVLDRRGAIVALGGGVVGDLAGFVAASLFRGIPVVQLPTTLVAMTDSAIGGKTGVDLPAGKNLVGAFWQPRAVIGATAWLATLPPRETRAAYGELWKYALLEGPEMMQAVRTGPVEVVIRRAAALKAWIVGRDEREQTGERALLNLGHTVGHAIETAAGGRLVHGECVALGLVAAARVSRALVGAPAALEAEVVAALEASGLDASLDPWLTDEVLDRIAVDKKRAGSKVGFITVRDVGQCEVVEVEVTELRRILRRRESL